VADAREDGGAGAIQRLRDGPLGKKFFAMIDEENRVVDNDGMISRETKVPSGPEAGLVRDGGILWLLGRKRGLSVGM
jgi:hypothetical protein